MNSGYSTNKMGILLLAEKIRILEYRIANPEKSYRKIADFFRQELGKKVDHTVVYRIMKNRAKLQTISHHKATANRAKKMMPDFELELSKRVYDKFLEDLNIAPVTTEVLQKICKEIARDPNYGDFFKNYKFG